jgi:hypothetical protein
VSALLLALALAALDPAETEEREIRYMCDREACVIATPDLVWLIANHKELVKRLEKYTEPPTCADVQVVPKEAPKKLPYIPREKDL